MVAESAPVIYLLHGDDEFAMAQFVTGLEARVGDASTAAMNVTRLDGRNSSLEEAFAAAAAMPFLASRRLVVLYHPLARLSGKAAQESFLEGLEHVPPTSALVLVEDKELTDPRDRRKGKLHWLEKWAQGHGERVYLKAFPVPRGAAMTRWIQERARAAGGQFTPQAAGLLATLVGEEPRLADQEIQKLLTYVNFRRPVEVDDVENLTADTAQGDIFAMVDALGNKDGRAALSMLHRLLETQDSFSIFGMIVRQFRLLLLAREVMDAGGQKAQVAQMLKVHPYVAGKISDQARHFDLPLLELVYHRLSTLDEAMKTGQMPADLALDTLVAAFTDSQRVSDSAGGFT
jgi:DNA polymerase-3 subunit delta